MVEYPQPTADHLAHAQAMGTHYDRLYESVDRYWWQPELGEDVLSPHPNAYPHSLSTCMLLRTIESQPLVLNDFRVLSVGEGEGTDAVRLARMGCSVDAMDVSATGLEKLTDFAKRERVSSQIHCIHADVQTADIEEAAYDAVIAHGVLHEVPRANHPMVIAKMRDAVRFGGIISISTLAELPKPETARCYGDLPFYPDFGFRATDAMLTLREWDRQLYYYEHKSNVTHQGATLPHMHLYGKMIAVMRPQPIQLERLF